MKNTYTKEQKQFIIQFIHTFVRKKCKNRVQTFVKQFNDKFSVSLSYNAAQKVLVLYESRQVNTGFL